MLPKNILVPVDFSPCAEHALDYACHLAAKLGATLHVVHAIGTLLPELSIAFTDERIASLRQRNAAALDGLVAPRRRLARFGEVTVLAGDAREAILGAARTVLADLIIMGTHGRRGLSRVLLGSVAEEILRRAACPVLTVRPEGRP